MFFYTNTKCDETNRIAGKKTKQKKNIKDRNNKIKREGERRETTSLAYEGLGKVVVRSPRHHTLQHSREAGKRGGELVSLLVRNITHTRTNI